MCLPLCKCIRTLETHKHTRTHTFTSWHERPDSQENPSLFSTFSTHTKPTQRVCVQIRRSNREHTHTYRNTHVCGGSECDSVRGYTQRTQRRLQCGHMTCVCEYVCVCVRVCLSASMYMNMHAAACVYVNEGETNEGKPYKPPSKRCGYRTHLFYEALGECRRITHTQSPTLYY